MFKVLISLLLTVVTVCLFSCNAPGGIGHEGEARISGALLLPDGTPAAETEVTLYPKNFDPVKDTTSLLSATTSAAGTYQFADIIPGNYTIVAVHKNRTDRALISDIDVVDSIINVPSIPLQRFGAMKILLSQQVTGDSGYVYVPGTTFFGYIDNHTDYIVLDSIPAGNIPEVTYTATDTTKATPISQNILVTSNDTAVVRMPNSGYSRTLVLNTTATGAGISEVVTRFPVLVRLNAQNFDFSQSNANGSDLYFRKPDATLLPHAIERWDSTRQVAELWVKTDTIQGNSSSQYITMYWGNPATQPVPSEERVFDTADGYQGVWHLGDEADVPVLDATVNHYHSGAPLNTFPSVATGVIGRCRWFDGATSFMAIPNSASGKLDIPVSGHYSVSAWVYLDSLDGASHCITSKGYEQYYLRSTYIADNMVTDVARWEFVEYDGSVAPKPSQSPARSGEWVHVVGVRQENQQLLYINGELTARVDLPSGTIPRSSPYDLFIGRFSSGLPSPFDQGYCYFRGSIDELRISSRAYSENWIKLCYMNQRVDNKLVVFE